MILARRLFIASLALLLGVPLGLSVFTFLYGKGLSYFSDNPTACVNCHIMRDQFASWGHSSHGAAATCNHCHAAGSLIDKYQSKATNGFWHSWAFTTGRFPDSIRIKPHNREVVERACRDCHQTFLANTPGHAAWRTQDSCIRCHASAGHAR